MRSDRIYYAEYSTTQGQMWVENGAFDSEAEARRSLKKLSRAGNYMRIVAADRGHALASTAQLVASGEAEIL